MRRDRPGLGLWLLATAGLGALVALTSLGPLSGSRWESPGALFWLVVLSAALCMLASAAVVVVGHRDGTPEIGLLGGGMLGLSVMGLTHGLTVPGLLHDENTAVTATALLTVPVALVIAAPLLAPRTAWARRAAQRWRAWVAAWTAAVGAVAVTLLAAPDAVAVPGPHSPLTVAAAAASLATMLVLSWRQLRLYGVGRNPATLAGSLGLGFIGLTTIQWVAVRSFTPGFWLVHVLDGVGVLAATGAVAGGHRTRRSVTAALAPVIARDPLAALEIGITPVVQRFVAALDSKDPQTRDHVVRVGETAMRMGEHLRLPPRRLRDLGIAAILHDVGKLAVDDAILKKPDRLTDDEYAQIKRHTVDGERLLLATGELAPSAPFVRSHHERVDGAGYPDGLAGDEIPLEARIIAAADAHDAMAHTRHYRDGMGHETAVSVLQEHAGTQWDPRVVEALIAVVGDNDGAFARIGRAHPGEAPACGCADALPAEVREVLLARTG